MKKIGIGLDQVELDATHIIEDSECCLVVPAVIAREGVFPYPEGKAYKPAEELRKAAWTADNAWIVADAHPDILILMDPRQISGRVERSYFSNNGIKANLRFLKSKNRPGFLADIKSGKLKEVSIGFFYEYDPTPGQWNGKPYDFVQRNILIDHVAAGVTRARCAPPACGIAIDSVIKAAAVGDVEETEDYIHVPVRDADDFVEDSFRTIDIGEEKGISAVIGKLKSDPDGATHVQKYLFDKSKDWTMEKAQNWVKEHKKSADQLEDLSVEQIKDKIAELGRQQQEIMDILYPKPDISEEQRAELESKLTVIYAELHALEEALALKIAAQDQDEEGELEKKREAAKERCGKYPVSLKEDGHLTKPSEYENIPEDQFADPCNFRYPMDEEHVMAAWAYINKDENRVKGGYSEEEWTWMKNRVKKAMEAKGHEVEADALREIERAKRLLQS